MGAYTPRMPTGDPLKLSLVHQQFAGDVQAKFYKSWGDINLSKSVI
jgi:hypothetical protein